MWRNPQFPSDLVTFTGEIRNGKLHFLCSVIWNGTILSLWMEIQNTGDRMKLTECWEENTFLFPIGKR